MDENEIKLRERVIGLEIDVRNITEQLERTDQRLDKIDEIVSSIKEVVIELKQMRTDVNRIDEKVTEIEQKPAKNWDALISAISGTAAGGLAAALMGFITGG